MVKVQHTVSTSHFAPHFTWASSFGFHWWKIRSLSLLWWLAFRRIWRLRFGWSFQRCSHFRWFDCIVQGWVFVNRWSICSTISYLFCSSFIYSGYWWQWWQLIMVTCDTMPLGDQSKRSILKNRVARPSHTHSFRILLVSALTASDVRWAFNIDESKVRTSPLRWLP